MAHDCVIGAGSTVLASTQPGGVYRGNPATRATVSAYRMFGVAEEL